MKGPLGRTKICTVGNQFLLFENYPLADSTVLGIAKQNTALVGSMRPTKDFDGNQFWWLWVLKKNFKIGGKRDSLICPHKFGNKSCARKALKQPLQFEDL